MKPELIQAGDVARISTERNAKVVDVYDQLLEDLFLIRNPRFKFSKDYASELSVFVDSMKVGGELTASGSWFYFPWSNTLVHYLSDSEHQELRTARNRNLILTEEQTKLRNAHIAIAGMSVGSHCALTLNMMGMSRHMSIADPDVLSGSNMNRVRYDYTRVGQAKTAVAREALYQMDPYGTIDEYPTGVNASNVEAFLSGVDVLVEETDHLETKIFLREEARKRGIPVVMATDNGDGVIVDIERFDLDRTTKLFNGAIGDITLEEFKSFPPQELPKLAAKIAGVELIVPRMKTSLAEVGTTLYSWPQLGDAATLCGVTVSYIVKQIVLGFPVRSGKIDVNLDTIFKP